MRFFTVLWLAGCAATPLPVSSPPAPTDLGQPQPSRFPASELDTSELDTSERRTYIERAATEATLRWGPAGPTIGQLFFAGRRLRAAPEPLEGGATLTLSMRDMDGERLRVFVRAGALVDEIEVNETEVNETLLTPSIGRVHGHHLVLKTEDGIPFVQVRCTEAEVLRSEQARLKFVWSIASTVGWWMALSKNTVKISVTTLVMQAIH